MELKLFNSSLTRITQFKQLCINALSTHTLVCAVSLLAFSAVSYVVYQRMSHDAHLDHDSFFYDSSARAMSSDENKEIAMDPCLRRDDEGDFCITSTRVDGDSNNADSSITSSVEKYRNKQAPIQTIVYPCIVSLIYKFTHNSLAAVVFFQLLLALLTMLLIYRIAFLLFDKNTALVSLVLCCLNLGFITYTQLLLAEIVLTFLLMLFFERWVVCVQTRSYATAAQAGAALGCSLLVKPIALVVPLFLLLFAWWHKERAQQFGLVLVLCAMSYGFVGCYMVRNYVTYNAFSLAPMMSLNVYQCYLSKVIGRLEHRSSYEVAQTTLAFQAENPFDESGWVHARALFYQTCINHPYTCAYIWTENVCKTLFGLFATQFKQLFSGRNNPKKPHSFFWLQGSLYERGYAYITGGSVNGLVKNIALGEAFWSLIRWLLVLVACWLLCRQGDYGIAALYCMFILVLAGMTGMDGCCRYRMTFEPLLVILTAYTLCYGYRHVRLFKMIN